jgi:hypothetical protein
MAGLPGSGSGPTALPAARRLARHSSRARARARAVATALARQIRRTAAIRARANRRVSTTVRRTARRRSTRSSPGTAAAKASSSASSIARRGVAATRTPVRPRIRRTSNAGPPMSACRPPRPRRYPAPTPVRAAARAPSLETSRVTWDFPGAATAMRTASSAGHWRAARCRASAPSTALAAVRSWRLPARTLRPRPPSSAAGPVDERRRL